MVNLVAAIMPLLHRLMKMAGVAPYTLEIEPGTVMNFWVPKKAIKKRKNVQKSNHQIEPNSPEKPVVVLLHGFAFDGIVTWMLQVGALTKKYAVYVPDLLFFGGSKTDKPDRTVIFQAECLVKGLRKLGVDKCTVVGFSYGGMVAFKMAELHPEMVRAIVVSGSVPALTDSLSSAMLQSLGFSSLSEFLLPDSVNGLKALLSGGSYKKLRFPDSLHKDFLEVMFNHRKEKAELLEALVVGDKEPEATIPCFSQRIHLLWGENDQIFKVQLAHNMKEELGEKTTFQGINKAGHLVHIDRPCVFKRCLIQFLASIHLEEAHK